MSKTSTFLWSAASIALTGFLFHTIKPKNTALAAPISKLQDIHSTLKHRHSGDASFTRMLLHYDGEILKHLQPLGVAEDYKTLTARYAPTPHGFRANLLEVIQERLGFLTSLERFLAKPQPKKAAARHLMLVP